MDGYPESYWEVSMPLKFIDLFCGLGAFHEAFKNEFECVLACDIDEGARRIYAANHRLAPAGDIRELKEIPDFDILCAGFPCFVEGTRVLTQTGYKQIQDVSLDDKLMTHTGSFQSIVNLQRKVYTETLYAIKIKYHPEQIVCTSEHPFYVREKVETRKWNNVFRTYDVDVKFKDPIWKTANDLTMNDYFGMVVNTKSIVPEFTCTTIINRTTTKTKDLSLDTPDHWFLMGYFLGDGWIQESKKKDGRPRYVIRFAINNKDEEEVCKRITSVLPITDKKCDTGKCRKFGCQNQQWYEILKQFGKYAHGKKIPEWVQDAPIHFVEEFIAGYMRADGYVRADGVYSMTTVSSDIALGMQRLFLKLGKLASVNKCNRPTTCVIEGRTVNQRDTYTIRVHHSIRYTSFIEGSYAWFAPANIEKYMSDNTPVYNFEVDKDNSYIVENTIVHNCQPFSIAGNGAGFADDQKGNLFFEILRIIDAKTPELCILENVKNMKTHDSGRTYRTIQTELERRGYSVSSNVLNAAYYGSPQARERLFIVASRNGGFTIPVPLESTRPRIVSNILETNAVLSDICLEKYTLRAKQGTQPKAFKPHALYDLVNSITGLGGRQGERVYDVNAAGVTVCASSGGPGAKTGLYKVGDVIRRLTVLETTRMFGFPDTFRFDEVTSEKALFYLGNSIVVDVARSFIPSIQQYFLRKEAAP